ncbi:LysR family transcriptional regulator [Allocoprobacillus halotolerans]|uniref:LysR family transcriptional regulator n=1 Tax=Allocoprobacillus halotolerans TaxID=2944914 RepID=A0ABY5I490_9FIRM|nr:LysR family transcriptional regulator [Allocoprobacillus halotolerans]UTY40182.1 LysR family transcriptional regulator [Allocoprobacillus halotolerans]
MELRVLQYFLAIAREESISKAAEVLHITQPTLSRQIKELEEEFQKQLFIRGNRKITLTKDGILLKQYAQEILNLTEKAQRELLKDQEELAGDIYIGGGESATMRLIMRVIVKMQKMYPQVHFHLFSGNAQDVADKLDSGLLDFGIFFDPVNLSQFDYFTLPGKETMGVLMRKDSLLAKYDEITPDLLKNESIILSEQYIVKNEIAGWIGGNERKLNIQVTYNLINNPALLVEEGGGYALTFGNIIQLHDDSPLCFKPLSPRLEEGIHIAWKKYHVFSKQSETFLELLKEEVKEV